jgi:hypothetical protein
MDYLTKDAVDNLRSSRWQIRTCELDCGDRTANCRPPRSLGASLKRIVGARHVDFVLHFNVHAISESQSCDTHLSICFPLKNKKVKY